MELSIKQNVSFFFLLSVIFIIFSGMNTWKDMQKEKIESHSDFASSSISDIHAQVKDKAFPEIQVENQKLKLYEPFSPMDWITIKDDHAQECDVQIFGEVDNHKKGEYRLRYVVRNPYGLKSEKWIKVLVDA